MERQYTRIDAVRNFLDNDIKAIRDEEVKRCAYVHLYGVGQAAAFIAMKRGYDRVTAELAEVAGMLHDYTKYMYDKEESHAEESALCAKNILVKMEMFSEDEIELICRAIGCHSNKKQEDTYFDEILKDADEMQHYFRNPMEEYYFQKERTQKLMSELGVSL